jgi:fermentation-respiration switch protein FrsA (DUF1100 family)
VTIWHGDADDLVPPVWGERLAGELPHARLEKVVGAGHFLGYSHTAAVLESLVR